MEAQVLNGGKETIKTHRPLIALEVNDGTMNHARSMLENIVRNLGYNIYTLMGNPSESMYDVFMLTVQRKLSTV